MPSTFKPVDPSELGDCFETFQKSAFRLELLSEYLVPEEASLLADFRAGRPRPGSLPPAYDSWLALIRAKTRSGLMMQRVHLLPDALTEYLRFEMNWGYFFTGDAGEDIRILRASETKTALEILPVAKDYWLFDDALCYVIDYDIDGRFVGPVKVPPDLIQPYVTMKHELLAQAQPLSDTV